MRICGMCIIGGAQKMRHKKEKKPHMHIFVVRLLNRVGVLNALGIAEKKRGRESMGSCRIFCLGSSAFLHISQVLPVVHRKPNISWTVQNI